jgi:hypothetical protein
MPNESYIEITRYKDSDGVKVYVATPHLSIDGKRDFWTPLQYRDSGGTTKNFGYTLKNFLDRVEAYGKAWGIPVEKSY